MPDICDMANQNVIRRLNWRQILLHYIVFCLFIYAFQTISPVFDPSLLELIRRSHGHPTDQAFIDTDIQASDLVKFATFINVSGLVGLLVAFVISLIISIKRHWFWLNAVIALVMTYLFYVFDLLGLTYVKKIAWFLAEKFENATLAFLVSGIFLMIIGLSIFFLKRPNQFIENNKAGAA
jgi:hypothetical protein